MLSNLFRRKPPPPLEQALEHIRQASEIVLNHKRNKQFMPDNKALELFQHIETSFHGGYATTSYVHRCMQQRMEGKPEGATKFHDKEAADYHYPG